MNRAKSSVKKNMSNIYIFHSQYSILIQLQRTNQVTNTSIR